MTQENRDAKFRGFSGRKLLRVTRHSVILGSWPRADVARATECKGHMQEDDCVFLQRFDDLGKKKLSRNDFELLTEIHDRQKGVRGRSGQRRRDNVLWNRQKWDFAVVGCHGFAYVVKTIGRIHWVQKTDWLDPVEFGTFADQAESKTIRRIRDRRAVYLADERYHSWVRIADKYKDVAESRKFSKDNVIVASSDGEMCESLRRCRDPGVLVVRGNLCFMSREAFDKKDKRNQSRLWLVVRDGNLVDEMAPLSTLATVGDEAVLRSIAEYRKDVNEQVRGTHDR